LSPVEGRADPSAPAQPPARDQHTRVEPIAAFRSPWTLFDAGTPSWVYVGIGGGMVLIVALVLWLVLG